MKPIFSAVVIVPNIKVDSKITERCIDFLQMYTLSGIIAFR